MQYRALPLLPLVFLLLGILLPNIDYFSSLCPKNGDYALLSLSVTLAKDFEVLSGPYSRFHVFHPLPTYFYVYAFFEPLVSFAQHWSGRYEFIHTCLQCFLLLLSLCVFQRTERVRFTALFCILACLVYLPEPLFLSTWGPFTISIPLLCLCFATSSILVGTSPAWCAMALSFIFLVSNHLSGLVLGSAIIGLSALALLLRRRSIEHWNSARALLAVLLLLTAFSPALLDLWNSGGKSNPAVLYDYLLRPRATRPWSEALTGMLSGLGYAGAITWREGLLVACLLGILLRCKRLPAEGIWLMLLSACILSISLLMARSIEGTLYSYLLFYMRGIPVLWFSALGSSFLATGKYRSTYQRAGTVLLSLACLIVPYFTMNKPASACKGRLIDFVVQGTKRNETYMLVLHHSSHWPIAAGVVNELTRRGVRLCVPESWRFAFRAPLVCSKEEFQTATHRIHVSGRAKAPTDDTPVFVRKNYAIWITRLPHQDSAVNSHSQITQHWQK